MKRKNTLGWIWHETGKVKYCILFLCLIQIIQSGTTVLSAWVMRSLINYAVSKDRDNFIISAILFVCIPVSQIFLNALGRSLTEYSAAQTENRLKERLFSVLLKKDYSEVTAVHSGEWMNRLTSDTKVVADGVSVIAPELTGMSVKLIGAVISIIIMIPAFGAFIVPGGMLLAFFTFSFRKVLKKLHKNIQETDGDLRVFLSERLTCLSMIKVFAREKRETALASEKMTLHKDARMKRMRFSNICNIGFAFVMRGAYVVGGIYCAFGILNQTMTYGDFTAILQLIGQVQSPFANITGYIPKYFAMTASAERLMDAENYDDDIPEETDEAFDAASFYSSKFKAVVFENVDFRYRAVSGSSKENMPVVLNKFSMTISKGDYVAFTGHSGCGKSTVMKLLLSLYREDAGRRYIISSDKEEKLDSSKRGLFSYVPQGNFLMSGSVREIVTFSDKSDNTDDKDLMRALKIACADKFVNNLENGADYILGERGTGLSEGQMQRIAIARAVYSDNPILLLDEATSSLDEATEKKVLENLKTMTDKTVVIITHRPAALDICNKIIEF